MVELSDGSVESNFLKVDIIRITIQVRIALSLDLATVEGDEKPLAYSAGTGWDGGWSCINQGKKDPIPRLWEGRAQGCSRGLSP